MIEIDSRLQPVMVNDLDADWLLSLAEDAEVESRKAERRKLRYALRWAELHPASPDEVGLGQVEPVGSVGAPPVAELTSEDLAVAYKISTHAAMSLISDALDLKYRFPRLWARVEALEIPVWRARRIVQNTVGLTRAQADEADRQLAPLAARCGLVTIDRIVAALTADADADDQLSEEEKARSGWDVQLFHPPTAGNARWVGTSVLQISAMREQVILRDGHCVYPNCQTDARSCDLDHIEPYLPLEKGGPPGQTTVDNLACLCRRHHRLKTKRRWRYRRRDDGSYEWTGQSGQRMIVNPAGSFPGP